MHKRRHSTWVKRSVRTNFYPYPVKTLEEKFQKYDEANPVVWQLFLKYTGEAVAAGRTRLSVSLVIERIRWEEHIKIDSADGFKISNNHRAYYARKWNRLFGNGTIGFTLRELRGKKKLGQGELFE